MVVLVLICTVATVPEVYDCNRSNALDVFSFRIDSKAPAACMLVGQAMLAKITLGVDRDGEYSRIVCQVRAP